MNYRETWDKANWRDMKHVKVVDEDKPNWFNMICTGLLIVLCVVLSLFV
jgi:hypothetical protein